MYLLLNGQDFHFEMENICRLFLPDEKIITLHDTADDGSFAGLTVTGTLRRTADGVVLSVRLHLENTDRQLTDTLPLTATRDDCELTMTTLLYRLLSDWLQTEQAWGLVTGVRPVKLLRRLAAAQGEEAALRHFRDRLLVSAPKLDRLREVLHAENRLLALSRPESCSLYVSIPFCPTRCDYCSFVSQTVERAAGLIPAYVEKLKEELVFVGDMQRRLGLRLETVYFGGGTPTTLTGRMLSDLFRVIERHFDLSHLREYTVEAGRPDTVTAEKMDAIHAAGIERISINPQTLQDTVLRRVGRRHTVAQFYDAFALARRCGMRTINTDLIAGLPGDTAAGFAASLEGVLALRPENVTVHTLCLKRASNLVIKRRDDVHTDADTPTMIADAGRRLTQDGYQPYYLYRQSRALGNQENTGWTLPGKAGLYNVYIMDETHTVFGCGAGAVTKLKRPESEYLERLFNFKFPYEYISRFAEMLARKERVMSFYETGDRGSGPVGAGGMR